MPRPALSDEMIMIGLSNQSTEGLNRGRSYEDASTETHVLQEHPLPVTRFDPGSAPPPKAMGARSLWKKLGSVSECQIVRTVHAITSALDYLQGKERDSVKWCLKEALRIC